MVQKLEAEYFSRDQEFESSVVLDGTKTLVSITMSPLPFESSVVLDGTKTYTTIHKLYTQFESSVVLDGTKTFKVN